MGSIAAGLPFIKTTLHDMNLSDKTTEDEILQEAISELE